MSEQTGSGVQRSAEWQVYGAGVLPPGIRSRFLPDANGLIVHFLEAGYASSGRPALLLLHGFPELAFSWRRVMPALARAGYHVIAPDIRGYGLTTGWDPAFDADEAPFRLMNLVRDALALVFALGHRSVAAVLGHDAGSPVAAWAALARPDVFRSVMLLSTPFPGAPALLFDSEAGRPTNMLPPSILSPEMDAALARLDPPRQHYIRWYASPEANADMMEAPRGLRGFFRAYYHAKSADWAGNQPWRLPAASAEALAELPRYYIMDRNVGMAATVAPMMPSAEAVARCRWLSEAELEVYVDAYGRTGFSGGLWAYRRALTLPDPERLTHANRKIEVPLCFVSGASDWGTWQAPGAIEAMERQASRDFRGVHLVQGAGHWVQQEQPEAVVDLTLRFLKGELAPA